MRICCAPLKIRWTTNNVRCCICSTRQLQSKQSTRLQMYCICWTTNCSNSCFILLNLSSIFAAQGHLSCTDRKQLKCIVQDIVLAQQICWTFHNKTITAQSLADITQLVRVVDCDSKCCGFKSHYPPNIGIPSFFYFYAYVAFAYFFDRITGQYCASSLATSLLSCLVLIFS